MINLLPPEVKEQQRFARYNVTLLRYMLLIFVVAGFMSLVVLGGKYFADQQLSELESEHAAQQINIQELEEVRQEAASINTQLNLTKTLIEQQSYYSNFINELALATPSWAQISRLNLARQSKTQAPATTDTELRVDIDFKLTSLTRVSELQREILAMDRVDFVDIQNASQDEDGQATATLALGLNTPPHEKLEPTEDNQ